MKLNIPNILTLSRIVMIPAFLTVLLPGFFASESTARLVAFFIFIVASFTDLLDGFIARRFNLVTTFGKFADPLADKLLVSAALVALVELGDIPAWVAALIISREFIVTGLRLVAVEKGVVISASIWGKLKTVSQMLMIIVLLPKLSIPFLPTVGSFLMFLASCLTLVSMIDYLVKHWRLLSEA